MIMCRWEQLPENMQTDAVRKYYDILKKKTVSLVFKRVFDVVMSFILLILFSPLFLVLTVAIRIDSKGPAFYRQVRVTQYGRLFRIHKFRSMVAGADKGLQVTVNNDCRVTKVGHFIRKYRLDEICQLIDIFIGSMSFVGTRPEVPKYVDQYTDEMMATLLLPAGVTNITCVYYKDEAAMLAGAEDTDVIYMKKVLPQKMAYNLKAIEEFGFLGDIRVMFMTVFAVLGKDYKSKITSSAAESANRL